MSDAAGRAPQQVRGEQPGTGVLVQICLECGKEYTFDDDPPPENLTCEKCGGKVFRSYYEPIGEDEANQDFRDTTERDMATSDAEGETTAGDLVDLNNL
jgi:DNA-directed RNA polymerase subunit RPC12/RpoP